MSKNRSCVTPACRGRILAAKAKPGLEKVDITDAAAHLKRRPLERSLALPPRSESLNRSFSLQEKRALYSALFSFPVFIQSPKSWSLALLHGAVAEKQVSKRNWDSDYFPEFRLAIEYIEKSGEHDCRCHSHARHPDGSFVA